MSEGKERDEGTEEEEERGDSRHDLLTQNEKKETQCSWVGEGEKQFMMLEQ